MALLDRLIGIVAPYDCLSCGVEGRLLCAGCRAQLHPAVPCCYRCRLPASESNTCENCRATSPLRQVLAVTTYEKVAKDLVWRLKFAHAQGAAREIAAMMQQQLTGAQEIKYLIVPVPTATTRVRQRGYDQARLLARELAHVSRIPCVDLLIRQSQAHQVGASRQQRQQQLTGAFRIAKPRFARKAHILLIDDVVTTGATLEAAARCLQAAGAASISALVFAQPPAPKTNFDSAVRR